MSNDVQTVRVAYYILPIAALLVAFLELAALMPVPLDSLDASGIAFLLGPVSYLSVVLAVAWVVFLPALSSALTTKLLTLLGVVAVTGGKVALTAGWWLDGTGSPGWSAAVLMVSGGLLGAVLCAWSAVDVLATRTVLARGEPSPTMFSIVESPDQELPTSPVTPIRVPSPLEHRVPTGPGGDAEPPPRWQSVSTPWPRRDESDPEGTLIRPPRKRRPPRS